MAPADCLIDAGARQTFVERGVIFLPGLISEERLTAVREAIYRLFERYGVARDGVWTARATDPDPRKLRQALKASLKQNAVFRALATPALEAAVVELTDREPVRTFVDTPQLLFTPPDSSAWQVPHRIWHLDVPRLEASGCPGVQSFCCLDTVAPGGGGTVIVAGSHKLLNGRGRIASRDVKRRLARHAWFRDLFRAGDAARDARLMSPQMVSVETDGEVTLQVVELSGAPGDVYLVDLRTLHSLAPNTSSRPRLAATQRFFRDSVAETIYAGEAGQG